MDQNEDEWKLKYTVQSDGVQNEIKILLHIFGDCTLGKFLEYSLRTCEL